MTTQAMLDVVIALLASGGMTAEQQTQMSRDLVAVSIEHRRMRITLDGIAADASQAADRAEVEARRTAKVVPITRRVSLVTVR